MAMSRAIKVFARLKKEDNSSKTESYVINRNINDNNFEDLIFRNPRHRSHGYKSFRFHKVFGEDSTQNELFEIVAEPLINSALEGYNCTIFAYGQTGSGKTYTITGPPKKYTDRGIIPRSIQHIFKKNEKISPKLLIHISYMEIYNEIGYDLLHPKQIKSASSLEELPRIMILEDRKGESHIRNLSVVPVTTEEEAMKLLFLGDTNRTIAETSMNEFSSRSHCIFTIHITQGNGSTDCLKYSKLHIIDLAGSERVSKSSTTGTALTEAKHINLSLHYLQQVIVALSERRRPHIPYRNSIVTYLLKDSLNGNCLSTMIANLAVSKNNIEETISTCKYAHRVSLLKTEAVINEISDPQQEIMCLKKRIAQLEEQLLHATRIEASEMTSLTSIDKAMCSSEVEEFLKGGNIKVEKDMSKIKYCFDILREKVRLKKQCDQDGQKEYIKLEMNKLQQILAKKDEEIASLKRIIDNIPEQPVNPNRLRAGNYDNIFNYKTDKTAIKNISDLSILQNINHTEENSIDKRYNSSEENFNLTDLDMKLSRQLMSGSVQSEDIDYFKTALEDKLLMAKVCSDAINQCQSNILYIRTKLEECCSTEKPYLIKELEEQQSIYKKMLQNLREIKSETNYLQFKLDQTEVCAMQKYHLWSKQASEFQKHSHYTDNLARMENYSCGQDCTRHGNFYWSKVDCKRSFNHPAPNLCECSTKPKECFCRERSSLTSCANNCLQGRADAYFKPIIEDSISDSYSAEFKLSRNLSCCSCHVEDYGQPTCEMECYCPHTNYKHDETWNTQNVYVEPDTCEEIPSKLVYVVEEQNCENDTTCTCDEAECCSQVAADEEVSYEKEPQSGAETKAEEREKYFEKGDSQTFREFMRTVTLTGEADTDECIFSFYRGKFSAL